MRKLSTVSSAVLASAMAVTGFAVSAQAQTALNIAGATAGQPFVAEVPITLCDNPTGTGGNVVTNSTAPRIYMDGSLGPSNNRTANSKFVTWVCEATNIGLAGVVIRYQASGSSDGIDKPNAFPTVNNDGITPNPAARQVYVEPNAGSCGQEVDDTDALGRSRKLFPSCTQQSPNPATDPANAIVVNLGVSDVAPSTFNQSTKGWVGSNPDTGDTGTRNGVITAGPRAENNVTIEARPLVVPFSIVLGSAVKLVDASNNVINTVDNPSGRVRNLTRLQVEALLSRNVTRWNQISGLGADTDGNGVINSSDNQTVIVCGRRAGSGTKASLNAEVMKDAKEFTGGVANSATYDLTQGTPATPTTGPTFFWGISNGDVRDCVQGNAGPTIPSNDIYPHPGNRPAHPTAIAYMEADQAASVNPANGYVVSLDGGKPRRNDTTGGAVPPTSESVYVGNEKENTRCGKLEYHSYEAFITRNVPAKTQNEQTLITAFLDKAQDPNIINNLPNTGNYWVSPVEMWTTKNADKGPVLWKSSGPSLKCLTATNDVP
jgi:ABC-type phosphate transport system substrate-binding protein